MFKRDSSEENGVKLIAYTIMLYISCLFIPFVIVASFQSMFFYKREYWMFETPPSAYITFGAGMLLLAVLLTFYLIAKWKWENISWGWVILASLVLCVLFAVGGVDNYYYSNEKGIYLNKVGGFGVKEYAWDDMKAVEINYRVNNGSVGIAGYEFKTKSGQKINLPYTEKFRDAKWKIDEAISARQLPIKDNFDKPITE